MGLKGFICFFCLFISFTFAQTKNDELQTLKKTADSLYDVEVNSNRALRAYLEIDNLFGNTKNTDLILHTRSRIAKSYNAIDDSNRSIAYSTKNLLQSREEDNPYFEIDALLNIVISYALKREFDKALVYYEDSLKILEKNSFPSLELEAKIALAFLSVVNENVNQAIENYQEALQIAIKLKDYTTQNKIYGNLSHCFIKKREYEKAIIIGKSALQDSKKYNFKPKFIIPSNIGLSYERLKQYDSAMHYYKVAYDLAASSKVKLHIAIMDCDIGALYTNQKDYKKGITNLLRSYNLLNSIRSYPEMARVSKKLSDVYEDTGDYINSLKFLKKNQSIKDSLAKRSTDKKLEEFQTKYETKEKEARIIALDKENSLKAAIIKQKEYQRNLLWAVFGIILLLISFGIRAWQNINRKKIVSQQKNLRFKSIIETEQKERKRIARDLHDSLGQTISAIRMQISALPTLEKQKSDQEKLLKQVDYAYDELRNISHNIMPDTLIKLGLVPAIRELITELTLENILTIELHAEEPIGNLNQDQTINLYRIIQEIFSNIIKHAKATSVHVFFENKNKGLRMRITDNGKGMDLKKVKLSHGMGWKNMISRVSLISAKIEVQSKPNQGTTISILL